MDFVFDHHSIAPLLHHSMSAMECLMLKILLPDSRFFPYPPRHADLPHV